jgi:hypothetical protein
MTASTAKHRQLLALLQKNMATVRVSFTGGTSSECYTYKVPVDWNVQVKDQLVIDSPRNGMTVVLVVGVDKVPTFPDESITYKWAVQKVDCTAYDGLVTKEEAFLERLAEIDLLHKRANMLQKAREALGSDTEAAQAFDAALAAL